MARTAVGGDDPRIGLQPPGPGGIERGPRAYLPVGEDDHLHGRMLTAGGPDPM